MMQNIFGVRKPRLRFASAKLLLRRLKRQRWLPHSIKIPSGKQDFKHE